jgi:hypothetical protein
MQIVSPGDARDIGEITDTPSVLSAHDRCFSSEVADFLALPHLLQHHLTVAS